MLQSRSTRPTTGPTPAPRRAGPVSRLLDARVVLDALYRELDEHQAALQP